MRKTSICVVLLVGATGCSESSPGARLVGVWEASVDQMLESARAQGRVVPDELTDMSITVEFTSAGSFSFAQTIGNLEQVETGTWEVTIEDADRLRIKLLTEVGDRSESKEGEVVFSDDDTCEFLPVRAHGPPLLLRRKK